MPSGPAPRIFVAVVLDGVPADAAARFSGVEAH